MTNHVVFSLDKKKLLKLLVQFSFLCYLGAMPQLPVIQGVFLKWKLKKITLFTFFKEPTPLSNFCDETLLRKYTAQKLKFSIKNFISKCDQIRGKLRIWSHLLKKSIMENFIFCAVIVNYFKTPTLESRLYCWCLWCFIKCFQRKLILIRLNKSTILSQRRHFQLTY